MQYSLRNEAIAATLVGPRTVEEVEANVRHVTTALPPTIWDDLGRCWTRSPPNRPPVRDGAR